MQRINEVGIYRAHGARYHCRVVAKEQSAQGCDERQARDERCIALRHDPPFPSDHEVPGAVLLGPEGFIPLLPGLCGSAIFPQAPNAIVCGRSSRLSKPAPTTLV